MITEPESHFENTRGTDACNSYKVSPCFLGRAPAMGTNGWEERTKKDAGVGQRLDNESDGPMLRRLKNRSVRYSVSISPWNNSLVCRVR